MSHKQWAVQCGEISRLRFAVLEMTGRETVRLQTADKSDVRLSDGIETDGFSVISDVQHGAGRFLDFALLRSK